MSFQYFLKRGSVLNIPLIVTEYYSYNSVPSVESMNLMKIIEAKMGQKGKKSKCPTFIKLSALSGL